MVQLAIGGLILAGAAGLLFFLMKDTTIKTIDKDALKVDGDDSKFLESIPEIFAPAPAAPTKTETAVGPGMPRDMIEDQAPSRRPVAPNQQKIQLPPTELQKVKEEIVIVSPTKSYSIEPAPVARPQPIKAVNEPAPYVERPVMAVKENTTTNNPKFLSPDTVKMRETMRESEKVRNAERKSSFR